MHRGQLENTIRVELRWAIEGEAQRGGAKPTFDGVAGLALSDEAACHRAPGRALPPHLGEERSRITSEIIGRPRTERELVQRDGGDVCLQPRLLRVAGTARSHEQVPAGR